MRFGGSDESLAPQEISFRVPDGPSQVPRHPLVLECSSYFICQLICGTKAPL